MGGRAPGPSDLAPSVAPRPEERREGRSLSALLSTSAANIFSLAVFTAGRSRADRDFGACRTVCVQDRPQLRPSPATNFAAIPGGGVPSGPTGIVGNSGTSFGIAGGPAAFIFANLNGSISAWNTSNINSATKNAATVVASTPGASYTGLAITPPQVQVLPRSTPPMERPAKLMSSMAHSRTR
jgi:hypothetical protein